jgi:hypothetical protein
MIQTGFESRVKVQQIIENQLPEFILDESPKAAEFLKQYYISQEYQGGPIDIGENLDQYLKLDNLTPEVIVGSVGLSTDISASSGIAITVTSTKGFPSSYGLLKIDDEIITYTGITTNTFTGCIRGFSGITNYHKELYSEELVFSDTVAVPHAKNSTVENLSSLFLQEFYKKLKYTLTPGLESVDFVSDLNVGNFIKEARTLYQAKGTEESFRILFNVLFGETPKVIDLEKFLVKASSATYIRRDVVIAETISGNPIKLAGQTITKSTDPNTTASVSEVEVISRKGKTYYKLLLFIGYDDAFPTITGTFNITGNTKNLDYVSIGSSVISVDSTIGFPSSGKLYSGSNVITYTDKSINQFFGCSGVTSGIATASVIRSDETYYGYEDGDISKKVEIRITGVLSDYKSITENSSINIGEQITVKNIGEIIKNPTTNPSYKEIFANSWIYNTSSRYQIDSFGSGSISQFNLKSSIDKSSLKIGDYIDIVSRDSQTIIFSNLRITGITGTQVTTNQSFTLNSSFNYDIRRKIINASSSLVSLEFNPTIADVQNVYNENNEYMYVASNSLPSYQITKSLFSYNAIGVSGQDSSTGLYSIITFSTKVSFLTGSEVYYTPSQSPISGLLEGVYYVEVLPGNLQIKLYASRSVIGSSNYISFGELTSGTHNFILNSQKQKVLSPQKILRKFPLSVNIGDGQSDLTEPGSVGMLINGVEVSSYKSNDKIYYGPLKSVDVLNGGTGYDVINPPVLSLSSGSALVQPIVNGSVEKIYIDPQDFDIDVVVSVALTGGNGNGSSFEPVIEKRRREIEFDAKELSYGGGIDITNETLTFLTPHSLIDGQPITYRPGNNPPLGIGPFNGSNSDSGQTLVDESTYYVKFVNDTTIQLYQSLSDYRSGINTVGFTTIGTSGIQKFVTGTKNTLTHIKVLNGGSGYQNKKLRVLPTGISTADSTIKFTNHRFNSGELVTYDYQTTAISGLSTEKQYYVMKVDDDNFKLVDAGIAGTYRADYERGKTVQFSTSGSGYQIFNYPQISLKVEYSSVGLGSTQFKGSIIATPIVRGKIDGTYVYNEGSDYGSTILNYHNRPSITVKNGKDAQFKPVIINGRIEDVSILYGGTEYYSTPDIEVSGSGTGAILKPVVVDNKITHVIIVNRGSGYLESNTLITAKPAGKNAIFESQVRSITVNNNILYDDINDTKVEATELIRSSYKNLQYSVCGYSNLIQSTFNDTGSSHSPIIGWAYDGNPIYGSYGYKDPKDKNSTIKKLVPGYTANSANISNRPTGFNQGFFVEDYGFTNSGDLDECNGRFCVTPEFPNGVYAYFATSTIDANSNVVGQFPYFIGNRYRSNFINENKTLNQSFDFNNSNLIRNTFPYKVNDEYADNDFITESNEIINQITVVESVTSGSIDNFEIINSGADYKIGDTLQFDESNTNGGGLIAQVSEIKGKDIVDLQSTSTFYDDVIFTWDSGKTIKVKVAPKHNLENLDYVSISGFSTNLSALNKFTQIGVTSYTSTLIKNMPAYSVAGIVTDIYISNIPENISIGSSIVIESETLSVLNVFNYDNVVRVVRETTGAAHTATTTVYFTPDTFTINKSLDYFDSKVNDIVYFNPVQSVGVGTTSGIGIAVNYTIGTRSNTISIPTQSIYLPNHPFQNNQEVILSKPASASAISVANTSGGTLFSLPISGNQQTVYVIKQSVDYIGIVTQIGLTTTTNGLFFRTNGTDDYQYSLQSNFTQIKGDVERITTRVSVSTSHNLTSGDTINLDVKPNLSVGIGTSISIRVKYDSTRKKLIINSLQFSSSGINTLTDQITIPNHGLETGQKVVYTASTVATGLSTGTYYVYKVDRNIFKLCETLKDSTSNPPLTVNITNAVASTHELGPINPPLASVKNNNLVFDLSDSSLSGYNFKIFYDKDFKDEFVSAGSTSTFSIIGVGTVGVSTTASLTINYSDKISTPLLYALEKSGYISTADTEVNNYSQITFVDSYYNGSYKVFGIGTTTFNISLPNSPEKTSYTQSDCNLLEYTTTSTSTSGGISNIRTISPGSNFKKLPIFTGVESVLGTGAYIIPVSNTIGKINQIRILNEGFEYSSDKTLRPEASIPRFLTIENSNTIDSISVSDGGKNYVSTPNLIIVDSETGEKIDSGLLIANISGTSITSVSINAPPKGLPSSIVTIVATNNTNGIGIQTVQASSSGIVTCTLVTPLSGFGIQPFATGDKIFVEGIQKYGTDGDGFNSENYGYEFFKITSYNSAVNPVQLEFNLSGLTTNPGIAKTIQDLYGTIVNYKNYPKFNVTQNFSEFIIGETLEVKSQSGFVEQDLKIVESNENYIKVSGIYELEIGEVLRGTQSGSIASINNIKQSTGQFNISYASKQNIGWSDNVGKLDEDTQVIPDNDYYQNLSYSIKSQQEWIDIVSPVNNLLHISGLKNFADTQIINNVGIGTTTVEEYTTILYDIIDENRVDTINNFDLTLDVDVVGNNSRFLKFKNIKLADYVDCRTNRVLEIDDISGEFSSSDQEIITSSKITTINPSKKYNRYLVQVTNNDYSKSQLTELIILNNNNDTFTLEKGTINTGFSTEVGYTPNQLGEIYGYIDELGNYYLKFDPYDAYNTSYNIKYLNNTFGNFTAGVGTTSIGFVNLTGITSTVSAGSTAILAQISVLTTEAVHSGIHLIDNITNEMNYVEVFVDHDGTDTNISEFYFDTDDGLSSNFIGSFGASISGGILYLNYTNTSSNTVTIRSRNVGFGTTATGIGTYRFKSAGELDGYEKTVNYTSSYSNVSSASTIISFNKNNFTSLKSTIRVSIGQTSALHQVMLVADNTDVYTTQYPFLSIGSTNGIGTFGGNISGSIAELKFYPDSSLTGTFEVLSFTESFYSENDYVNTPLNLEYGNIVESVGVAKYFATNDKSINKLDFELEYQGTPIFVKTFNPSDSSILNLSTGEFNITNHFFNTGEELIYRPTSTFFGIAATSVGIGSTLNNVGIVTNILPSTVYAIKINNDKFKISTRKEYATAGISVTFTSVGSGNAHQFEMTNKNSKSIITINNIIQSPLAYSLLNYTVDNGGQIGTASTIFGLSGISSINPGDILKIDNEYMKVTNVGLGTTYSGPISFGGTFSLVQVERGFVGSSASTHSNSGIASVYRGSFNFSGNKIYFTDPPEGSLEDQLLADFDNLPESRAYFNGRVFLRKDYTSNQVYDNISESFTGIGQTYTLTIGGINTAGLGTIGGNGLVIINGIFQTPTTENNKNNNFRIVENTSAGISSVVFSGITSTNGSIVISQDDVNVNQLPRGGLIVSLGSTPGLGYAPLVGASVTAIVSGGIITTIGIGTSGNWGSGYRNPVSVAVTESGHTGTGATITAIVGAGGTLSFTIVGGGTGYTRPTINISSPNYENLPVTGVSRLGIGTTTDAGVGLLLNVEVGASSTTGIGSTLFEVTGFKITRNGYGFKRGDVIRPVGLVTAYGLPQPISNFELTVLDTFNDSFSAWQFGELDYIDSVKNYQDGTRTRFPLYYNSSLISFEKNSSDPDSQVIDFDSLLLIFINGILQQPKVAYQFEGGTSFTFTQAPKIEDNISIFFYRGSSADSGITTVRKTLKIGDDVQVFSNNNYLGITTTQNQRIITDIVSSNRIQTNLYTEQGIDTQYQKPLSWTKQKIDKIIDGNIVSKARDSIEPQIYPTAKIIKNISSTDTQVFVDNAQFFNYENEIPIDFSALIISGVADPVSAAVTAVVSAAGTIQSLSITNAGSGYTGASVTVSISAPQRIGVGVGTTATATISIVNGSLSTPITITNPGLGYTISSVPQVIVPLPDPTYENISNVTTVEGFSGNIVGIGTTVGIGTALAIKFTLDSSLSPFTGLSVNYPIYVFDTKVGGGITSIYTNNTEKVAVGTTFSDNIYNVSAFSASTGIVTCNILSTTSTIGIATTGPVVGKISWGRLSGFTRSSSVSIAVSSYSVDSGLSTFPTIQRRGYGLRNIGPIKKDFVT